MSLSVSGAPAGVTAGAEATGTITDDDTAMVTIEAASATEGESLAFTVRLSKAVQGGVTVTPSFTDGTATADADYTTNTTALSFTGTLDETKTIAVSTTEDDVVEGDETFTVSLSVSGAPAGVTAGADATGTITDDDSGSAVVTIAAASATEGESLTFTVRLSRAVQGGLTVTPSFTDGTATADADYTTNTTALSFTGTLDETKTIAVSTTEDEVVEGDETFTVSLAVTGAPSGVTAGAAATGTITDDDSGSTVVTIANVEAAEGESLTFTVRLSRAVQGGLTVTPSFTDGTATADADYTADTTALSFTGTLDETKTIAVSTTEDEVVEGDETFTVSLAVTGAPSGVTAGAAATGTITDDDSGSAVVTIANVEAAEGESLTFTVRLSRAVQGGLTVTPSFTDGTATADADYTADTTALSFTGTLDETKTIAVSTTEDEVVEGDETFTVSLAVTGAPSGVTAGAAATGTITDDDSGSTVVTIANVEAAEGESLTFTVRLSRAVQGGLTVTPSFTDGTATADADYTADTTALSFTGTLDETKTIAVSTTEDEVVEGDETFTVSLSVTGAPSGVTAGTEATGTITDDDTATVTIEAASAAEGESLAFTVRLSKTVEGGVTVTPSFSDVTTTEGTDYTANAAALSFVGRADETKTIAVSTTEDEVVEGAETFTVSLSVTEAPAGVTAGAAATGTITDDDSGSEVVTIANVEAAEGDALRFTVSLSKAVEGGVTVTPSFTDGTATADVDYTADTTALSFAGTLDETKTIAVSTTEDDVVEGDETFTVSLSVTGAPAGVTAGAEATGTITDDDTATVAVAGPEAAVREGGAVPFTVSLSGAVAEPVTVSYATEDGTASAPGDYTATNGTLTFSPDGGLEQTIEVATSEDALNEAEETFTLTLTGSNLPPGVSLAANGAASAEAAIADDDPLPEATIGDVTVTEGAGGETTAAAFTVTLSAASGREVTVAWATADGTAESGAGKDYEEASGTLTFSPGGVLQQSVAVAIRRDELNEADERFTVTLSAAANATLSGGGSELAVTGTIGDDDALTATVSAAAATVAEGGSAAFPVTVSGGTSTAEVVVNYTVGGTAESGTDYTVPSGMLTLAAGATSGTITIATKTDMVLDPGETLVVTLSGAATDGRSVTVAGTGTTTITDSGMVTVSVSGPQAAVTEGQMASFTVRLSGAVATAVEVGYATKDGTAKAGTDYTATNGTLTFSPGALEQTIEVATSEDTLNEAEETFTVTLTSSNLPPGVSLDADGAASAEAEIGDDDALTATVSAAAATVAEGGSAAFPVTVSGGTSTAEVVVNYTVGGTAESGTDYTVPSGMLTLAAGATSGTITIATKTDMVLDPGETLVVTLRGAATDGRSVTVAGTGTTTITDSGMVTVSVSGPQAAVTEGQMASFTVRLSGPVATAVEVGYATKDGTAKAGTDYTATNGTLTFSPGALEQTIEVATSEDTLNEAEETFTVTLTSSNLPPGVSLDADGAASAEAEIGDDDALTATVSAAAATVAEGGSAAFPVTVSGGTSTAEVVVNYTVGGTAESGTDYTVPSGMLTLAAGATSGTITIATKTDMVLDPGETLVVTLRGAATDGRSVTVAGTGTTTITDSGMVTVSVSGPQAAVTEGQMASFTVRLSGAVATAVEVGYATKDGTAKAGTDYTATNGTLTFSPGALEQTIEVATSEDTLNEAEETFTVTLTSSNLPPGVSLDADGAASAEAEIGDDDALTATVSAAAATVAEGGSAAFPVTVSGGTSTAEVVVNYTVGGTAESGTDYTVPSGMLTLAAGATSGTITIATKTDMVLDPGETLVVTLRGAATDGRSVTVAGTGTTTIRDSGMVTVSVSGPQAAVTEGQMASFTVRLSGPVATAVEVGYATKDGTAKAGTDYTATNGTLTFSPGALEQTIEVATSEDTLNEAEETFTVTLTSSNLPPGVSLDADGAASAEAEIGDDDALTATVSAAAAMVAEGGSAAFPVTVSGGTSTAEVVVNYTVGGTAESGTDYTVPSGMLTLAAGATSGTITIATKTDMVLDPGETLVVTLRGAATDGRSVTVAGTGTTTIRDSGMVTVSVSGPQAAVTEGQMASFTVRLSGAVAEPVTVSYATADGTAKAGTDYTATNGTLTFSPGAALQQTVAVATAGDTLNEAEETFTVTLTSSNLPPGVSLDADGAASAEAEIDDDDELTATVSAGAVSVEEGGSAEFPVTVSGGTSTAEVVVNYTVGGTAESGTDYTVPSGMLTLAAGATSGTITIATKTDMVLDPGETLVVTLSGAATDGRSVTVAGTGTTTIRDSGMVTVSVSGPQAAVTEGQMASFTVRLSGAVAEPVTVSYATADGTAKAGTDYTATNGTLTFSPGAALQQTVAVATAGDTLNEAEETFTVTLTSSNLPPGVSLDADGAASAEAEIDDDDELTATVSAGAVSVEEGGSAEFPVTVSGGTSTAEVVVSYAVGGTAESGSDYTAPSGMLTLAAGATSGTITVETLDDMVLDPGETLVVTLSGAATDGRSVTVAGTGTTTIRDSGMVTVSVSGPQAAVTEGQMASFTVRLSGAVAEPVTVSYATADGTAKAGTDYTATNGTLTFSPGAALQQTVAVATAGDTLNEAEETFTVTLTSSNLPPGVSLDADGAASAEAEIDDDDELTATVSAGAVSVEEGGSAEFPVTVSGGTSTAEVVVSYAVGGTAESGSDYTAPSGMLTLAAGATSGTITVETLDDMVLDPGETLVVTLSGAATDGRTVTVSGTGTTTITDSGTVTVAVAGPQAAVAEGQMASFTVRLSGAVATAVEVGYATKDGTAKAGTDYTATNGTLTFSPGGATAQTIEVATIDDTLNEAEETFAVVLTVANRPAGVSLGTAQAKAKIADDDELPTVAIVRPELTDVRVGESDRAAVFTVTLSAPSGQEVTVEYTTEDGTAEAGSDYEMTSGTLTFAAGDTSRTVTVPITGDTLDEMDETFRVVLSEGRNVRLAGETGTLEATGTIADDDDPPEVTMEPPGTIDGMDNVRVGESDGEALFTVRLSAASGQEVTVEYTTKDGTAEAGSDYDATSGTLTFEAGDTGRTLSIAVSGDDLNEEDETLTVELSGAKNATLDDATATVTITDDDGLTATVSAGTTSVEEGDMAVFPVAVSGGTSTAEVVVRYAVSGGTSTAEAGDDYTAPTGILTLAAGAANGTISIATRDDGVLDPGEWLEVELNSATTGGRAVMVAGTVMTTITDPGTVMVSVEGPAATEEAPDGQVPEGEAAVFTVRLSGTVAATVSVGYDTEDGTAKSGTGNDGNDYEAASGVLTFSASGALAQSVTVATHPDDLSEGAETFAVVLTDTGLPDGVSFRNTRAEATIADDETAVSRSVSIAAPAPVREGAAAAFTVRLSGAATDPVTVAYATADGTAESGKDYEETSGTLTFSPGGALDQTVTVATHQDDVREVPETFAVTLTEESLPAGVSLGNREAVATITDDDEASPELSIADVTVDEGAGRAAFTVSLRPSSGQTVTVSYVTADGTATAGSDYTAASGILTFVPGETRRIISVAITDDPVDEDQETFTVRLHGSANATLDDRSAIGTIVDNDAAPELTVEDVTVDEDAGNAAFMVTLSASSRRAVTVSYATADGSAAAGADYTAASGELTFVPGSRTETILVAVLNDVLDEDDETFTLLLSDPVHATLDDGSAIGTIVDDDAAPELTVEDVTVDEDAGNAAFMVTLSASSGRAVTVSYATADGSAAAGADYTAASGELTFAPGSRTETILVAVLNDVLDEDDETFTLLLSDPVHATLDDGSATATIVDDDVAPAMMVADARAVESAGEILFVVRLETASGREVSVVCTSADETATAGQDYVEEVGLVTFAPGETEHTVRMVVLDDAVDEPEETFSFNLSEPTHATLTEQERSATGTIVDDDQSVVVPWLARFGRTVGSMVLDAVADRTAARAVSGGEATVAGQPLESTGPRDHQEPHMAVSIWDTEVRGMEVSELLSSSFFRVSLADSRTAAADLSDGAEAVAGEGGDEARWTAWGRGAAAHFAGVEGALSLDGDVLTGVVGIDRSEGALLAGVAVAHSSGKGTFEIVRPQHPASARDGELEAALTSVHPYVRVALSEDVSVWSVLGYGRGTLTRKDIADEGAIGMLMGALGLRGAVLAPERSGGLGLTMRSDVLLARMTAEATTAQLAAEADVARLRLTAEGSAELRIGAGRVLTPKLGLGMRYDAGAAETGTGLEMGGGLIFTDPAWGLTLGANVRGLLVHEDRAFQEWGAGASLHLDPGAPGSGPALSAQSSVGAATSATEHLWSVSDPQQFGAGGTEPPGQVRAELSYGIITSGGHGAITPYTRVELRDGDSSAWTVGGRVSLGTAVSLDVAGIRRVSGSIAPDHRLELGATLRW